MQQHAEGPHVYFEGVVHFLVRGPANFGRHVRRGADGPRHRGVGTFGKSEVTHFHGDVLRTRGIDVMAEVCQQHIFGLDVAMDDVLIM